MFNLEDFLTAAAKANSDEWLKDQYSFEWINPKISEWHASVLKRYTLRKEKNELVSLEENEWKRNLLMESTSWLKKRPKDFDLEGMDPREYLLKAILEELGQVPDAVYKVQWFGLDFMTAYTMDYFFETSKGVYWLCFSVE